MFDLLERGRQFLLMRSTQRFVYLMGKLTQQRILAAIRYNDPYGSPFELIIPDGEPEALREIVEYLNKNARLIRNAERREAYHTLYHLEALDYESNSIAYLDTPEHIVIQKEEAEHMTPSLTCSFP